MLKKGELSSLNQDISLLEIINQNEFFNFTEIYQVK